MIRPRPSLARRAGVWWALGGVMVWGGVGVGVGRVFAAEEKGAQTTAAAAPSSSSAASAATEDPLAAARREFEAVKAARDPALQGRGEVPRFSMPDIRSLDTSPLPANGSGGSANGSGAGSNRPGSGEAKSSNWLVEAMEKPATGGRGRERMDDLSDKDPRGITRDGLAQGGRQAAVSADRADELSRKNTNTATAAANPLNGFLGTWMSAQDYALLKSGVEQAGSGAANRSLLPGSSGALGGASAGSGASGGTTGNMGSFLLADPTRVVGTLGAPSGVSASSGTSRENPYLANLGLNGSAAPTAPTLPVSVPPPAGARTSASSAPASLAPVTPSLNPAIGLSPASASTSAPGSTDVSPTPPTPKTKVPDFVKPSDDDKYFKQLKRF